MPSRQEQLIGLLERAGGELHGLLLRLTLQPDAAEDLMQDLFIKLSRSNGWMRARDPQAYACRAAINLAFNWRRDRRRKRLTDRTPADPIDDAPSPLVRLIRNEQLQSIFDAMDRLSVLARQAVVLHYIQQEDVDTVARQLGKTPHQVRAICSKALRRLRQLTAQREDASGPGVRHD